ncbi:MAG: hypothetical protein ACRC6E_04555 [Fusobacteriaceae bacterium]
MVGILKSIDLVSWVVLVVVGITLIGLYAKRTSPIVKEVITNAILEAERLFNGGEGQKKLEFAVTIIRLRLPKVLGLFITKSMLVSMIEIILNKISHTFELKTKVDIMGNDNKVNFNVELHKTEGDIKDRSTEMYGAVKTKTDWKDNTESTIEIGFKKKF